MNIEVIRKLQATLLAIKNKEQVFFNTTQFEDFGLSKQGIEKGIEP